MVLRILPAGVFLVLAAGLVAADEVKTLSGKNVVGTLVTVSPSEVVVETKDGPVKTPLAQVLAVTIAGPEKAAPSKYSAIRLLDDSVLYCKDVKLQGTGVEATLTSGATLKLPISGVVWLLHGAEDSNLRKQFEELTLQKVRRDRLVILRDGLLNPLDGTLGEPDAQGKTIPFKREGLDAVPVQLERIQGMIFYRTESPSEAPIVKVFDRDGNVLSATKLAFESKTWQLTTPFGAALSLPEGAVAKLDFNLGKLTYLSDLDPTKVIENRWGQSKDVIYPYRRDTSLDGQPIMMPELVAKGLSMHAYCELHYDLGGKYKELRGILGVERRLGANAHPVVEIFCDGEKRFSQTVSAKELQKVNINVKEVTSLKIVVRSASEIGGLLGLQDHVTFADARVSQ
jgi:hypothetical protein